MPFMKLFLAVCAVAMGFAGLLNAADSDGEDALPKALPANHYDKLARQNPFILPTAAPVASVITKKPPNWSDGLTAVAVMQQGDDYVATVYDRNTNERFPVGTSADVKNSHDIALASVKWANTLTETTITLRKGGEFFPVKYDPNTGGAPSLPPANNQAMHPQTNPGATANRQPAPVFNNPPAQAPSNVIRRQTAIRAAPPANPAGGQMRLPVNNGGVRPPPGIRPPPGSPAVAADDDDDE
jgi:hypothetical protein